MTMRSVTRAGTAALLAAGVVALAATPALAADVDFGVDVKGTTLALGAGAKPATITISNDGSTKPAEVKIKFDASGVNLGGKAEVQLGGDGDTCELDAQGRAECLLDESIIPGPGASTDVSVFIAKVDGATGKAGKLTVSIEVDGDGNAKNDSDTVDVTLAEDEGVDLTAFAEDVTLYADEKYTGKPIPAGGKSVAEAYVVNFGDRAAAGVLAVGKLPKGATFVAQSAEGCDFSADRRSVRCYLEGSQLTIEPGSIAGFRFAIVVAADVKGPVSLQDGSWSFVGFKSYDADRKRTTAAQALPDYVFQVDPIMINHNDIDPSDNVDGFAVLVAGTGGGSGGGADGDDGDDPGLPVTGPVAGTVAGVGGVALIAGAVLFVTSRRRRVVLVTPGDGQ